MGLDVGIYVQNSREAVELYLSAFQLNLGYHVLNDDGSYFHSELLAGDRPVCSVVEAKEPLTSGGNPIELGYTFQTQAELERAFELLKEGGQVSMKPRELPWSPCAACVLDRFGVRWYLSLPGYRPPEDFKPGDEK